MVVAWGVAWALTCTGYGEPVSGVAAGGVDESSGVAASRVHPGVYFTHSDDGEPVIHGFDAAGEEVGSWRVDDAELDDWEDLAAAPCPDKGDCLYIGDIGDNDGSRPNVTIYVAREPEDLSDDRLKLAARYTAVYPDGPVDAEALLVQPCTGRIHVVTKADSGLATVYRLPFDPGRDTAAFEEVARVEIDGVTADTRAVTAGDWDADGERLVLRTAGQLLLWETDPAVPNAHWTDAPQVLPASADDRAGEGVAFDVDGGLVTTSEGAPMPFATLDCADAAAAAGECTFPQTGGCGCTTGARGAGLGGLGIAALLAARRRRR